MSKPDTGKASPFWSELMRWTRGDLDEAMRRRYGNGADRRAGRQNDRRVRQNYFGVENDNDAAVTAQPRRNGYGKLSDYLDWEYPRCR